MLPAELFDFSVDSQPAHPGYGGIPGRQDHPPGRPHQGPGLDRGQR